MSRTIQLFGMTIDAVDMKTTVARLHEWIAAPAGRCRFVVTPNTDHAVMYQHNEKLRDVYADAGLVLADGFPVVAAAKLLRRSLPGRVCGSDLVPALFESTSAERPLRTFLLGAGPGVAEQAKSNIRHKWPAVEVVGTYSPPMGFEKNDDENAKILAMVADATPDVLVVGLGAPKQELWVHRFQDEIAAPVALCVGATIDFLAGEKARAPMWMRHLGLEWLHRCVTEPRRLAKRYAHDAFIFPQLVWREWRGTTA